MAKQIKEIVKDIPFPAKQVFVVFLLSFFVWFLSSILFTTVIKLSLGIKDNSYMKILLSQPQILSLYILLYCIISGLLTWFLLIKKIKYGLGPFFKRESLREDLSYGFRLFVQSLGAVVLFFILLIFLFAIVSKIFGLDYELIKNIYLQGREAEMRQLYIAYRTNVLLIFLVVFFGPLYEEIFYRGCLYTALRKQFSFTNSVVISSLFFALIHGYIFNFFPVLLLGIILAYAYEKRVSLTAPLVLHFCWNVISALFMFLEV